MECKRVFKVLERIEEMKMTIFGGCLMITFMLDGIRTTLQGNFNPWITGGALVVAMLVCLLDICYKD